MFPKRAKKTPIVVTIAGLAAALGVYFLVSNFPRIPEFPICKIEVQAQKQALEDLKKRVMGFSTSESESQLIADLEQIHRIEASSVSPRNSEKGTDLASKIAAFRKTAASTGDLDRQRFLLLGDYLAVRFDEALSSYLSSVSSPPPVQSPGGNTVGVRLIQTGGSFVTNALRTGAITKDGTLHTHTLTPQVLFRVRWRHFGDLRLDLDFSEVEKAAYHGFVARFGGKQSLHTRLTAIKELKRVCPSFDTTTARALVMHEGGDDKRAKRELDRAIRSGRGTPKLRSFLAAID